MKKKKIINSAVVGLGFGYLHAKILKNNKKVNLITVCDKNKKLEKYATKLKCNFTSKFKDILKNKDIDLVTIASYDNFHYEHVIACIKEKKHIFIEKPFCQNKLQYYKIKKLINSNKINFSTNFVLRNHPKFLKIKEIIKKNKIGKIYHLEGDYNYGRLEKLTKGWRGKIPFYSVTQGGGIHIIDIMIWILKSLPKEVFAFGNKFCSLNSKFKFDDNVVSLINFQNGVTGKVLSNFGSVTPHDHQMRIFGTKGTLILSNNNLELYSSRNPNKKAIRMSFSKKKDYKKKILNNFIDSIYNKRKIKILSKKEIFASMKTCLAIDKSLKQKKRIKLKN